MIDLFLINVQIRQLVQRIIWLASANAKCLQFFWDEETKTFSFLSEQFF